MTYVGVAEKQNPFSTLGMGCAAENQTLLWVGYMALWQKAAGKTTHLSHRVYGVGTAEEKCTQPRNRWPDALLNSGRMHGLGGCGFHLDANQGDQDGDGEYQHVRPNVYWKKHTM